jgi:hypothetical protein
LVERRLTRVEDTVLPGDAAEQWALPKLNIYRIAVQANEQTRPKLAENHLQKGERVTDASLTDRFGPQTKEEFPMRNRLLKSAALLFLFIIGAFTVLSVGCEKVQEVGQKSKPISDRERNPGRYRLAVRAEYDRRQIICSLIRRKQGVDHGRTQD